MLAPKPYICVTGEYDSNYTMSISEFYDEAAGTVHYITEDGSINYDVILTAVHLVMLNSKEQDIGIQV